MDLQRSTFGGQEVHHPVVVTKFIVIPENELDKVVMEDNASPGTKGGGVDVTVSHRRQPGPQSILDLSQEMIHSLLLVSSCQEGQLGISGVISIIRFSV